MADYRDEFMGKPEWRRPEFAWGWSETVHEDYGLARRPLMVLSQGLRRPTKGSTLGSPQVLVRIRPPANHVTATGIQQTFAPEFNIAAGDAAFSLSSFSRQAGLQILFDYNLVLSRRTAAIHGLAEN